MWTDFPISQDLIDQESDLSQREEQFLIDLADLYEHSTELERASLTIEQAREDLAKRPVDFAQTALNLNSYHRTLSERSRKAHLLLDEPLEDLTTEESDVLRLESEVCTLRSSLPSSDHPTILSALNSRKHSAESQSLKNSERERALRSRQSLLDVKNSSADSLLRDLSERAKSAEARRRQTERDSKRLLDSAPKTTESEIENAKQRKELLNQRKVRSPQRKSKLAEERKESNTERESQERKIEELEEEIAKLRDLVRKIDEIQGKVHAGRSANRTLLEESEKAEDEEESLRKKVEEQDGEWKKMNEWEDGLKVRKGESGRLEGELEEKERVGRKKREEIRKVREELEMERDEIEGIRMEVRRLEEEVGKVEKELKKEIVKGEKMQEKLDLMAGKYPLSPGKEYVTELQELLAPRSL